MALSYNEYTGDGIQTNFVSKPYLKEEHVNVYIDGTLQATNTYSISGTTVALNAAPIAGSRVRIARNTSQTERLHDYQNASLLTADQMDADANQLFFLTQEAFDTATETNLAGVKFYTAQATVPSNPNVGDLWYDINSARLKVYSGTEWGLAVPLSSTATYESFTAEGNYSYISVPDVNTKALVFLNGVKLIQSSTKENVLATATNPDDYFVDVANNKIYFATLAAGSIVEVVLNTSSGITATTITGGGSSSGSNINITEQADGTFILTDSTNNLSIVVSDGNNGSVPIPTITDNGLNADGVNTYTIDNGAGDSVTFSDGLDGENPLKGVDYFDGDDGSFKSFIFLVSNSQPSTPTGGSFNGTSETFPTGWSDTPSSTGVSTTTEWVATTRYNQTNGVWANTGWSVPAKYFEKGAAGDDGTSINIKGTFTSTSSLQGLIAILGDAYIIGGDIYVCTTASNSSQESDFTNAGQFSGADGANAYVHYAYANFSGGVISDFSLTDPTGRDYLGIYTDSNVADSPLSSAYTWQLVKGTDGTTIDWKGTYADRTAFEAANTPQVDGMAYYDTALKRSFIYQDGAYYQVAADGESGTDGVDGMVWKGESDTPPVIPYVAGSTTVLDHAAAANWAYKDTGGNFSGQVRIYDANAQAWELMVENGTNGNHGEDGADGLDGVNVYFCFHNSPVDTIPTKPHAAFLGHVGSATASTYPSNGWTELSSDDSNWMCQKTGLTNSNPNDEWGDPIRISGFNGVNGTHGTNGAGMFSGDMTTNAFTNLQATALVVQKANRNPVVGDVVTLSEINDRTNVVTKICTEVSELGNGNFTDTVELFIDGSLVVDGTIVGSKILAGTIDSNHIATNTLDANRLKVNTLDVGGAAIDGSLGIINGTAGNDVYMPYFPELFGATWVNYSPYHLRSSNQNGIGIPLGAPDTVAGHSPYGGDSGAVYPLMHYSFTTYNFQGTAPFIVQVGLDPIGDFRTTSESTFAFAMKATSDSNDYFSTDETDYVTTRGSNNKGLASTGTVNMSDVVTLTGNTEYHIWVFGALEDVAVITANTDGDIISRGIRDGFITVTGLNA